MKNGFNSFSNRVILVYMAILIMLLCGTVHAQMSSDRINIIAKETSEYLKNTVTPADTKDKVVTMVKDRLSERGVGDDKIYSILANINNTPLPEPFKDSTLDHITGIVKGIIINELKRGDDTDRKLKELDKKLENLEAAKEGKMLAPHKDVDFLFESVVGDTYDTSLTFDRAITIKGFDKISINKIKITTHWFEDNTTELFNNEGKEISSSDLSSLINGGLYVMTTEAKMQAVERKLGITKGEDGCKCDGEADMIKRIGRAYDKINNKDWQYDEKRFGVLTAYMPYAKVTITSIALHGYLAYRRFSPGKWDLHNWGRRVSGFFAVGAGSAMDSANGKSADVKGPVLSGGFGFDIVQGFVISAGWSVFSYKSPTEQDYNTKGSLTVGITLSTDLWKALFNNK